MDINDLIRYENENTSLDFKAIQYTKDQFESLIKDVMAMANSDVSNDKFIIVGIKHRSDGQREYLGIERSEFIDSATYQQLILENIEPDIQLDYLPYEFDNKIFGIIKITNCFNRPYMMKKNYNKLKRGDCFIRKGSQQSRLGRRDLDRIIETKSTNEDFDKVIQITFCGFNDAQEIQLPTTGELNLPSERARKKIISIIEKKKSQPESEEVLNPLSRLAYTFTGVPYEDRSIEELEENLIKVKETYMDEDYYEIFEENSHKINFSIMNNGHTYLEDCLIEVRVKKKQGLLISSRKYKKPENNNLFISNTLLDTDTEFFLYPKVETIEDKLVIKQELGNIKHHQPSKVFMTDLRIVLTPKLIKEVIEFECTLFGKNLSNPIKRILRIYVKEPDHIG